MNAGAGHTPEDLADGSHRQVLSVSRLRRFFKTHSGVLWTESGGG